MKYLPFLGLGMCAPKLRVSQLRKEEAKMGSRAVIKALPLTADPRVDYRSDAWLPPSLGLELARGVRWHGRGDFGRRHLNKDFPVARLQTKCMSLEEDAQLTEFCFVRTQEAYRLLPPVWVSDIAEDEAAVTADMPLTLPWSASVPIPVSLATWLDLVRPSPPAGLEIAAAATTPAVTAASPSLSPKAIWFRPLVWGVAGYIDKIVYTNSSSVRSSTPVVTEFPLACNSVLDGIYGLREVTQEDIAQFETRKEYGV